MRFKNQPPGVQVSTPREDNVPKIQVMRKQTAVADSDNLKNVSRRNKSRITEEGNSESSIDRGWAWMILFGSFTIWLTTSSYHYFLLVLFIDMVDEYNTSIVVVTTLLGVMHILYCISTQVFVNLWTNIESPRIVSTICSLIYSLSTLLIVFTSDLPSLFIASIVKCTVVGGICLPPMKLVGRYFDWYRSFAIGVSLLGISIASLLVPPLSRFLTSELGLKGGFFILCGIELQAVPASLLLRPLNLKPEQRKGAESQKSGRSLQRNQEYDEKTRHENLTGMPCPKTSSPNKTLNKEGTALSKSLKIPTEHETHISTTSTVAKKGDGPVGKCTEFLNAARNIVSGSKLSLYDNVSRDGISLGAREKTPLVRHSPTPASSSVQIHSPPPLSKDTNHQTKLASKPTVITVLLNDHQKLFSVTVHQKPLIQERFKKHVDSGVSDTHDSLRTKDLKIYEEFNVNPRPIFGPKSRSQSDIGNPSLVVTSNNLQRPISSPSADLLGKNKFIQTQNETQIPSSVNESESDFWWWAKYTSVSTWAKDYFSKLWWKTATKGIDLDVTNTNATKEIPLKRHLSDTDINVLGQKDANKVKTNSLEYHDLDSEDVSKHKRHISDCILDMTAEHKRFSGQIETDKPTHYDPLSIHPLLNVNSASDYSESGSDGDVSDFQCSNMKNRRKQSVKKEQKYSIDYAPIEKTNSLTNINKNSQLGTALIIPKESSKPTDKKINKKWYEKCVLDIESAVDLSMTKNVVTILLLASYSLIYSGTFIDVFIVSFAMDQNVTPSKAAVLIPMITYTDILMKILYGYFVDLKMLRPSRIIAFTGFSMVPVCFCARLYSNYESLVALAVLHGAFGMVGKVLKAPLIGQLLGIEDLAKTMTLVSLVRGVVISIQFPLHGLLIVTTGSYTASFYYVGSCFAVGAMLLLLEPLATQLQCVREERSGERPYRQRMVKYIKPPPSPLLNRHLKGDIESLYK